MAMIMRRTPEEKPETAKFILVWNEEIRTRFIEWMKLNGRSEEYIEECVRYLDKYMRPIRSPADVIDMFATCKGGRQHLDRGFRNLLKFYRKVMGFPKSFIEDLKEAIPTIKTSVDDTCPRRKQS